MLKYIIILLLSSTSLGSENIIVKKDVRVVKSLTSPAQYSLLIENQEYIINRTPKVHTHKINKKINIYVWLNKLTTKIDIKNQEQPILTIFIEIGWNYSNNMCVGKRIVGRRVKRNVPPEIEKRISLSLNKLIRKIDDVDKEVSEIKRLILKEISSIH